MNQKISSLRSVKGIRNSAGVGYIVLPPEIDREKYVKLALQRGIVAMQLENGGVVNVIIPKHIINDIEFPNSIVELGSLVFWVNVPKYNQPFVVGVYNKNEDLNDISEKAFCIKRIGKGNVEIYGDGNKGSLNISVSSSQGGELNINVSGEDSNASIFVNGVLQIKTSNEFSVESNSVIKFIIKDKSKDDKITEMYYEKGIGFYYLDEFENKLEIKDGAFVFNNGDLGGLPVVGEVKSNFQNVQSQIDTLKTSLIAAFTALSGLDASASLNAFNSGINSMTQIDLNKIENEKIKQ